MQSLFRSTCMTWCVSCCINVTDSLGDGTLMIRTKIVATMGPACRSVEILHALFEAGVDVCRLNFSHDSLDGQSQTLRNIRQAAVRSDTPIAVLGDLGGPKIRLGKIADENDT